jgi:hypothetical protein
MMGFCGQDSAGAGPAASKRAAKAASIGAQAVFRRTFDLSPNSVPARLAASLAMPGTPILEPIKAPPSAKA